MGGERGGLSPFLPHLYLTMNYSSISFHIIYACLPTSAIDKQLLVEVLSFSCNVQCYIISLLSFVFLF